ncbi:hypothetical protein [Actinoallomurus rhizosphaericola]|uniref:hypothetical protein n=1 Tax=Actinoallomurus rhizosphaericola TaxID=2952536 RepID=UPI00209380DF|nr:hypothetical protein [Actinoallomurus rhizosphaericola]MCO5995831.1 hypothetical protein [Actinoallomurus rhizosphaericola]
MTTYDPIVEIRALRSLRLLSPLRPPEPGRALVLVPRSGEPYAIHHGGSVPSAWVGKYQSSYLVDMTEHWLKIELSLLSKDPSFAFRGSVGLLAGVNDPIEVVARGIRDVGRALEDHTRWLLRQVSRDYDIAQFHDAERALNVAVRGFTGDSAIRLRDVTVELQVDDEEVVASGRAYRDAERDARLSDRRRDRHLAILRRDGVEALLAEIFEREGPQAVLDRIAAAEDAEREELMRAWQTVLNNSDVEPFDMVEAQRTVLRRLMEGSSAPFGGTRSGRLRGTIPAASAPPELASGPLPDDDRDGSPGRGGVADRDGRRAAEHGGATGRGGTMHGERAGGRPGPSEGPPEDEPDGGADRLGPRGAAPGEPPKPGGGAGGGARQTSRIRGARPARHPGEGRRP